LCPEIDIIIMIHALGPSWLGSCYCIVFLQIKQ
jgi:hypothetical protein